jgi:glycosyltransferase involved in cell wall biosynthesis
VKTVVLNATTLVKGGALQACVNFIISCINDESRLYDWTFVVSRKIYDEVSEFFPGGIDYSCFRIFYESPAKSISSRRAIERTIKEISPELVFTFFGPSYCQINTLHLCGVADGWVTHSGRAAFNSLPGILEKIKMLMLCFYKAVWFRKADYWVVEADCAKRGLISRIFVDPSKIYLVKNNCGIQFFDYVKNGNFQAEPVGNVFRVLTFSAYYPHKNIELIPVVARILNDASDVKYEFYVTLSDADWQNFLPLVKENAVESCVKNLGQIPVCEAPEIYVNMDAVFIPTLLETFSASYPEAMLMEVPIIASDFDFARDICQDSALYFSAYSAEDAAEKIRQLYSRPALRSKLVQLGADRVRCFPSPEKKYDQYINIINSILS